MNEEQILDNKEKTENISKNILESAFNFLDKAVAEMSIQEDKLNKKISKNIEKSENFSEKSPEINIEEKNKININELDFSIDLKEKYKIPIMFIVEIGNNVLIKRGIDPITEKEIDDLMEAIISFINKDLKYQLIQKASTISNIKSVGKWLKLAKAIWNILGRRLKPIKEEMEKISKSKKEIKNGKKEEKT